MRVSSVGRKWDSTEVAIVRQNWRHCDDNELLDLLKDRGFIRSLGGLQCWRRANGMVREIEAATFERQFEVPPAPKGDPVELDRKFQALVWQEAERCGLIRRAA